jgi:hypothetical protein
MTDLRESEFQGCRIGSLGSFEFDIMTEIVNRNAVHFSCPPKPDSQAGRQYSLKGVDDSLLSASSRLAGAGDCLQPVEGSFLSVDNPLLGENNKLRGVDDRLLSADESFRSENCSLPGKTQFFACK